MSDAANGRAQAYLARLAMLSPHEPAVSNVIAAISICGDLAVRAWVDASKRHPEMLDVSSAGTAIAHILQTADAARALRSRYTNKPNGLVGRIKKMADARADRDRLLEIRQTRGSIKAQRVRIGRACDAGEAIRSVATKTLESIQRDAETLGALHALLPEAHIDPRIADEAAAECVSRASELAAFAATVTQARAAADAVIQLSAYAIGAIDSASAALDTLLPVLERNALNEGHLDAFIGAIEDVAIPEAVESPEQTLADSVVTARRILHTQDSSK